MAAAYTLVPGDGQAALDQLDDLAELYRDVYAEPPYLSGPLWSTEAFIDRTRRQAGRDGFAIVTARADDGELMGYSFGLPFAEGKSWSGDATPPPEAVLASAKFAVIELIVRRSSRGQGIGRRLLDTLLADRPEPYAILTAHPEAPARQLYERWGWKQIGTAHHTADSPVLDSLVYELRPGTDA